MNDHPRSAADGEAVDVCIDNYRLCRLTAQYCRDERTELARVCVESLDDCAECALLLADLLTRRSPLSQYAAPLVREAARRAADRIADRDHEDARLRAAYASCQAVVRVVDGLLGDTIEAEADERDEALEETFPASDATPTMSQAV